MSDSHAGGTIGTKTFVALMTIMIIAFLAGLLIMNSYYVSMQSELATTKDQVANLQQELSNLNQNYTLLMEAKNYLLTQVSDLSQQVNMTKIYSRTFAYSITMGYDNKTVYITDEWGNETVIPEPVATFGNVSLTPQTAEAVVAEPWSLPISRPQWIEGPIAGTPLPVLLQTSAVRAYFIQATTTWSTPDSWDLLESGYREHHDVYNVTMMGTVQILYFVQNKTINLALVDENSTIQSQVGLTLP